MVIADKGYPDPTVYHDVELDRYVRSRHEHINKRMRHFAVLSHKFIHDPVKHSLCFRAVANLTQLALILVNPYMTLVKPVVDRYNHRMLKLNKTIQLIIRNPNLRINTSFPAAPVDVLDGPWNTVVSLPSVHQSAGQRRGYKSKIYFANVSNALSPLFPLY